MQLHIIVKGRVQGVCFRYNVKKVAESLGIDGWVKNISDGDVEALFEGSEIKLIEMLTFVNKGPFGSRVTKIKENWKDKENEFEDFRIKY
ncbi:MAG: acylphosphatase [Candidatus Diapherotrites archaeon]|jgi:acylphosphatase|uniref:Acylphosphatase n=1 Tax=Candidatus Iainarchaeum sp. TaxID=3101447 RepID=A0A8T5GF83_9ARCH|nr:acylphosphatase [Candidatus Diapherotrites archaeon]MBT7241192.1 acylphosphatase [Candidatus Diapherotrites archaeon]